MEFKERNIFKEINKNGGNMPVYTTTGGWPSLLSLPLDKLKTCVLKNNMGIKHYLNRLKDYTNKTFKELAEGSNFKETYLKDIFTINPARQKRMPSRDCIIGLSFAFELNLKETNFLLKAAGFNELYPRDIRDLIIIKSIMERFDLRKCNALIEEDESERIGNLDVDETY